MNSMLHTAREDPAVPRVERDEAKAFRGHAIVIIRAFWSDSGTRSTSPTRAAIHRPSAWRTFRDTLRSRLVADVRSGRRLLRQQEHMRPRMGPVQGRATLEQCSRIRLVYVGTMCSRQSKQQQTTTPPLLGGCRLLSADDAQPTITCKSSAVGCQLRQPPARLDFVNLALS
jgi:hypothetical protein